MVDSRKSNSSKKRKSKENGRSSRPRGDRRKEKKRDRTSRARRGHWRQRLGKCLEPSMSAVGGHLKMRMAEPVGSIVKRQAETVVKAGYDSLNLLLPRFPGVSQGP